MKDLPMRYGHRVGVVIPALNEESAIGRVIGDIPSWVDEIVVADNGSNDGTVDVANAAGARVVSESRRGYGSACQAGIAALGQVDVVVFLDGDYSDDPRQMDAVVDPIVAGAADLVIGSRVMGRAERGALMPQQRFGNWLACRLMRLFFGATYTDLGPFRAIRADAMQRLGMQDQNYGWTVEMQIKASQHSLLRLEVPVTYRARIGVSKISGTVRGTVLAGLTILRVIARSAWSRPSLIGE
jgi:glycosyltransferase involved in cell wall biosynthesis